MDDHAVADLFRTWGLPPPDAVRRAAGGTNNVVRIVDAGGSSYVVRGYQNLSPERVAAEHRLLMAVAGTGLPFAVPTPIPAADGVTHVRTPSGVMAVFSYLPGRPPDRTSLAEVERAGTALADLDLALAGLAPELAPVDWRCPLAAIHPAVPDVDELGRQLAAALPGDPGAEWLRTTAGPADQAYALLHGSLPVQIVHGDVALSNLLVDDHGVPTAMLDFEVAGLDVAVNDLVAAVFQSTRGWWTPGCADASNAFCRGFGRRITLTPGERAAFADLLRRRALGSAVWRAGRWRLGQASLDEVRDRLAAGVQLERWLDQHAAALADGLATL